MRIKKIRTQRRNVKSQFFVNPFLYIGPGIWVHYCTVITPLCGFLPHPLTLTNSRCTSKVWWELPMAKDKTCGCWSYLPAICTGSVQNSYNLELNLGMQSAKNWRNPQDLLVCCVKQPPHGGNFSQSVWSIVTLIRGTNKTGNLIQR